MVVAISRLYWSPLEGELNLKTGKYPNLKRKMYGFFLRKTIHVVNSSTNLA